MSFPADLQLAARSGRSESGLSGSPVLVVDDLVVDYVRRGGVMVRAVAGVSLAVARGQIVGLVGESGCGKSTLARAIVGLTPSTSGSIAFEGRPVNELGRARRPKELVRLQMIFQDSYSSLNPRRRIGSQLLDGIDSSDRHAHRGRVADLLEQVGLSSSVARRFPHEFSGGQRQRVAIARALAANPTVIVADEAVAALDASNQAQISNLLVSLCRELGVGLLFISHDLALVRSIADNVMVMYLGRIVESAPVEAFWSRPQHPYTQALIRSFPLPDGSRTLPEWLPGEVPDPAYPPAGCRFRPRCSLAHEQCQREPPLQEVAPEHHSACWLSIPNSLGRRPNAGRLPVADDVGADINA